MKTETIAVRVPTETKRQLLAIAEEKDVSLSRLLTGYLDILCETTRDQIEQLIDLEGRLTAELVRRKKATIKAQKLVLAEIEEYEQLRGLFIDIKAVKTAKKKLKEATAAMS